MSLKTKIKSWLPWSGAEGSQRGQFYGFGEFGSRFPMGYMEDGYQRNLSVPKADGREIPTAYACVMSTARAVSQCRPVHKRLVGDDEWETVTTSAASRIFRAPNAYETWSQFIMNAVAQLMFDGESFSMASRNNRGEIVSLDRADSRSCSPYITPEEKELFYGVGGANPFLTDEVTVLIPARDILHLRTHCPRHPLIGEGPLRSAALAAGVNVALSSSQAHFFAQMSRPSGILSTDAVLNRDQIESLREAWTKQSQRIAQGHVPVLSGGLKFQQMHVTSQDSNLIEAQRMSIEEICKVYGTPLPIIGDMSHATLSNVEQMISLWLSVSLGSFLENLEQSFTKIFDLPANERIDFDTQPLLRTDFEARISGLTSAIQGGLYTVNEARKKEGLHPVPNGEEPIVQQQMVPLGFQPEQPVAAPEPVAQIESPEERAFNALEFRKALRK
jgi:HK97 family phage portal protein